MSEENARQRENLSASKGQEPEISLTQTFLFKANSNVSLTQTIEVRHGKVASKLVDKPKAGFSIYAEEEDESEEFGADSLDRGN